MRLEDVLTDPALAERLAALGVTPAQLEASVRSDTAGHRGDRMMIERAPDGVLDALLEAFEVPRVDALVALERAIREHGLWRIAGWDAGRGCVKLYANASDAPPRVREALGAHVVGVNAFRDGTVERKRYHQREDASGLGDAATRLVEAAGALAAGVVVSLDPGDVARAFFVALRPASPEALDAAFGAVLPGFSSAALAAHAPFAPASPRSIGVAAARFEEWTAYVKPRDADEPEVWSLEPTARFAIEGGEVAVYVAPADHDRRVYARVGDHAVSYRVVAGQPSSESIRALMDRVLARLAAGRPLDGS
ncbi:MAG: hypothetical protein R3B82_03040 [Sandaracinaceae bacterium]